MTIEISAPKDIKRSNQSLSLINSANWVNIKERYEINPPQKDEKE
jgi:hypothetical protein